MRLKPIVVLVLITLQAGASNYMPISKIKAGNVEAFQTWDNCVWGTGETCLDVGENPKLVEMGYVSVVDNWGAATGIISCAGPTECADLLVGKCIEPARGFWRPVMDLGGYEAYCSAYLGKRVNIDVSSAATYLANVMVQAQSEALIQQGRKAREDCQRVLDLIGGMNLVGGRTQDQINSMTTALAPIKEALQDGRPGVAKAMIQAIVPDGVLVNQAMKNLALAQLKDW